MTKGRGTNRAPRRRGKGTWRTNDLFGSVVNVVTGVPEVFFILGNIPQAPVAPGHPEPVTEYEISRLEGGLEPGIITIGAALTDPINAQLGFGLYMIDLEEGATSPGTLDPLNSTDVCRDNWLHLEWDQWSLGISPSVAFQAVRAGVSNNREPMAGRHFRFSTGPRTLKEGKALAAVLSYTGPAGSVLEVTPYFRYHLRVIT